MAERVFEPRLGRIRSSSARRSNSYLNRITREMKRAGSGQQRASRSTWSGSRNGRGFASAARSSNHPRQLGRRRVIVKARITKFKGGNIALAKSHLRYLQRDGVTREGERGELYNARAEGVDGKSFLEEATGDRHQFRLIVAPEDAPQLCDLKCFTRDLMRQAETDLGTKLNWVAVDHFNTGHPHTHIVIRGKDELGHDLVIARDYMSHGFRDRARDLMTLELGPETQIEMEQKLQREMTADRFTRIDRSLLRDTEDGILEVSRNSTGNQQWQSLKTGRLRKLQTMGLAEELKPGVWQLAERIESVLRDLGQRNDIMKVMQRVLKDAGLERGATELNIIKADDPTAKVVGKIIHIGLSDEINNRHCVVVDGIDGKLHYANIGQLNTFDPPAKGLLVTLKGQQRSIRGISRLNQQAQIFIEPHASLEQLTTVNGATWLDRTIVMAKPDKLASCGFGTDVQKALLQRQRWLVQEGFAKEQQGHLVIKRRLLAELSKRNIENAGVILEKKLGMRHREPGKLDRSGNGIVKSVRLASGRFAIMQQGKEFALIPWRRALQMQRTKALGIGTRKGISR